MSAGFVWKLGSRRLTWRRRPRSGTFWSQVIGARAVVAPRSAYCVTTTEKTRDPRLAAASYRHRDLLGRPTGLRWPCRTCELRGWRNEGNFVWPTSFTPGRDVQHNPSAPYG